MHFQKWKAVKPLNREGCFSVTKAPAQAVGLDDRGEIAIGKRADLVRVRHDETPVVRTVWRDGQRVI